MNVAIAGTRQDLLLETAGVNRNLNVEDTD
jgi:hypothetical protein